MEVKICRGMAEIEKVFINGSEVDSDRWSFKYGKGLTTIEIEDRIQDFILSEKIIFKKRTGRIPSVLYLGTKEYIKLQEAIIKQSHYRSDVIGCTFMGMNIIEVKKDSHIGFGI